MFRIISVSLLGLILQIAPVLAQPVSLTAADGISIQGDVTPASGAAKGVILLFHQAGSNHAEYAPIAPRLAKLGWTSLAIDQRSGGSLFGGHNQTAASLGGETSYAAALPDLEAALRYARQTWPGKPVLVWGSSYSAALVFILAARHPGEVAGVLAFSPGEYLDGLSVRDAAAKITVPIYVTSASDQAEERAAEQIIKASPSTITVHYVPPHGTHGASTLREDSDPLGYAGNWTAVERFLTRFEG